MQHRSEMEQEDGRELNIYVMLCVARVFLPFWVFVPQQGFFPMWGFFPEKVCCWHLALNEVVVLCFVYFLVCVHVCLCCVVHNGR